MNNLKVVLIGGGGFSYELGHMLSENGVEIVGIISKNKPQYNFKYNYLGGDDCISRWIEIPMAIAIGNPILRGKLHEKIVSCGGSLFSFVHPTAYVSATAKLSEGVIIYPNSTVHAGVCLRDNVFVNSNVSISHETIVGINTIISPGSSIGGASIVGSECYIGLGSCILEGIKISNGVTIGGGAMVVRDCLSPNNTYVGIPAKLMKS